MISGHREDCIRVGTVGPPLPGVEVKISEEGEILVKGDYCFSRYYKMPEATDKAVVDGWWHSGGRREDGCGRPHHLHGPCVRTWGNSSPENKYSPQYIESGLRFSTYIKDSMAIGDKTRDFVTAIIIIDFENVGRWAEINRVPYTTFTDLSQKDEVAELIRAGCGEGQCEHFRTLPR